MKKVLGAVIACFLAGCAGDGTGDHALHEETDYQPFVIIEGESYQGLYANNGTLEIEEKMGEVINKTKVNQTPEAELESNVLDEGTVIYSVKTYVHYFIAELGGEEVIFVRPSDFEELGNLMESE